MVSKSLLAFVAAASVFAASAIAQDFSCEDDHATPAMTSPTREFPLVKLDPGVHLLARYTAVESQHRLTGLASYYSNSLEHTVTADGERYQRKKLTAAHLTLPLGTWIEVTSRATGKRIRVRVNDRGPYVKKFCIDLSRAAAHALGVDVAEDRHVTIRIIALPGEDPLPADVIDGPLGVATEEAGW